MTPQILYLSIIGLDDLHRFEPLTMSATQKPKQHTNSFSNEDKRLTSTSRRKFVQNSLLYGSGALAIPTYLKGGNHLFLTSKRKVNHVVLCLFAGGIRNFESLEQREGNLFMPNTLIGEGPIHSSIASGIDTMPCRVLALLPHKAFCLTSSSMTHR